MKALKTLRLFLGALLSSLLLTGLGIAAFTLSMISGFQNRDYLSASAVSHLLKETKDGWRLLQEGEEKLRKSKSFLLVLDSGGDVVYTFDAPEELPSHYTAADVASFSRWYLLDYPVEVWRIGEGDLLVVGSRGVQLAKYNITFSVPMIWRMLLLIPVLTAGLFLLMALLSSWREKRLHRQQDRARSEWITGISHDLRTPLSVVMGRAEQMAEDERLPKERRREAGQMVEACTGIRDLIRDLNLTMRLDYAMQPLQRESLSAPALLREAAAGMLMTDPEVELEINVEEAASPSRVQGDKDILERAILNLLRNAVVHGSREGMQVTLSADTRKVNIRICNEVRGLTEEMVQGLNEDHPIPVSGDGSALHGTGIRLARQAIRAHRGRLVYQCQGETLITGITLPRDRKGERERERMRE